MTADSGACRLSLPATIVLIPAYNEAGGIGEVIRDIRRQGDVLAQLESGTTTRRDVLELLGPPSQVISLEGETVCITCTSALMATA